MSVCSVPSKSQVHQWQWARTATGSNAESANTVTTDKDGNVFVAGYFYSNIIAFGSNTFTSSGNYDAFVAKYDSTGNFLWAKSSGGIYDDVATGITVDVSGNVYVTGYFYSPSLSVGNFTLLNSGAGDIFITKYSSSGTELWSKQVGGSNEEQSTSITTDVSGDLLLSGLFSTSSLTIGNSVLNNSGGEDLLVAKLNNAGTFIWGKSFAGSGNDKSTSVTADASGKIFITGSFSSPTLISGIDTIFNKGSGDAFVAALTSSGTTLWFKNLGGLYNDGGNSIKSDSDGNVLLVGTYNSPTLTAGSFTMTNAGGFDFFIAKYSSTGNLLFLKREGGIFDDTGYGIATDVHNHIYVTGHTHSPSIIIGSDTINNKGIGDIYVAVYSSAGNNMWNQTIGGTADDGSAALATDPLGNLLIAGYFISPQLTCPAFTLNNSGGEDLFIGKLKVQYNTTSVNEIVINERIIFYPNPSMDGKFKISTALLNISSIAVFNSSGIEIISSGSSILTTGIDLGSAPAGLYYVKITIDNEVITAWLVVN